MSCSINGESVSEFSNMVENREEKKSWVVNVKCDDDEMFEGEIVCRICHLNSDHPLKSDSVSCSSRAKPDLMVLGCGCKGELSVAHSHCAQAWFKRKGNSICEICGQTVTNVGDGVADAGFMNEWKGSTSNNTNTFDLSETSEEEDCWHSKPLCNLLIACLVIAFVIPWIFHDTFW